ncbi:MAG: hypothetical protein HOP08_18675 [Cyclobacteriaceae bacterium]|nr:hypothetical protein [Cyclobacteriaceae bacterium]
MTTAIKPATTFWIIGVLALLWNLMGVSAYVMQIMMTPEAIQALPENEQALYTNIPMWATMAFAIAVFGGALASVLLLMRKKLATTIFMISFVGIVVQMIHSFFISNSIEVYGPGGMVMPVMIIVIGAYLIWYSKSASDRGWIN